MTQRQCSDLPSLCFVQLVSLPKQADSREGEIVVTPHSFQCFAYLFNNLRLQHISSVIVSRGALCRSLVQTPEARRLTAYHESGHALVAMHSEGADPIHKATIVPRGHALGMVSQVRHPFVRVRHHLRRCPSVCPSVRFR